MKNGEVVEVVSDRCVAFLDVEDGGFVWLVGPACVVETETVGKEG